MVEDNTSPDSRRLIVMDLNRRQDILERVVTHVPAAIAFLDTQLIVQWVNPEFERQYRLPAEALVGRVIFDALPGSRPSVERHLESVLETGHPFTATGFLLDYVVDEALRRTLWDITLDPQRDGAGRLDGVLWLSTEVSDRVERDRLLHEHVETLRRAHRMKDELLSLVSHELRTPLHALMGFGRLLEKGRVGALNDGQLAYVRKMLGVAEHLSLVVQDILDMSHLQAGTLTMDVRPMALGRVVEDTASDLAALAEEKRLALGVQLAPDLPQVMADAQRVRQVLINLISNAIKFTPAGGAIQVKVRAIDGVCRCDVVDSGPGIALEDLPKLFKPFTQLDMSSTRENGGSGLGLAITKGIVEGHGGSIGVTSEPGKGSAFFFMLPAAPDAPPTE